MSFAWPVPDTWWRRSLAGLRLPHIHFWRTRTVDIDGPSRTRIFGAVERTCRCGEQEVVGGRVSGPLPGPPPLLLLGKLRRSGTVPPTLPTAPSGDEVRG